MSTELLTADYTEQLTAVIDILVRIDSILSTLLSWVALAVTVSAFVFVLYIIFKPFINYFR